MMDHGFKDIYAQGILKVPFRASEDESRYTEESMQRSNLKVRWTMPFSTSLKTETMRQRAFNSIGAEGLR